MKDFSLMLSISVILLILGFLQNDLSTYSLGLGIGIGSLFMNVLNDRTKGGIRK